MENTFKRKAPTDTLERVHEFARDLAYGVTIGLWHSQVHWLKLLNPDISKHSKIFAENLRPKWGTDFPSEYLLLSFGYFETFGSDTGSSAYLLTQKAFQLLEKPSAPPSVFISYRRQDSSAFALLLEARLRLVGNPNPFVDKNLIPGEEWNIQLKQQIETAKYFVVLVGNTTLSSPHVLQEIEWAKQSNSTIISIWHQGALMGDDTPNILNTRHAIRIALENALEYENAVNQLLNAMGYSTY